MKNNTLTTLAKQAKSRMKSGYWNNFLEARETDIKKAESEGKNASSVGEFYKRKLHRDIMEDRKNAQKAEREYRIVCNILSSETEIMNPLMLLVDSDFYDLVTEEEKHRYILKLSGRYVKYKQRYFSENSRH